MMKKSFIFLVATMLFVKVGDAQIVLSQQLQKPIELAIERNTDIKNKEIELDKSALDLQNVKEKHIPKVEALGGYGYLMNKTTIDLPGYQLPITNAELFKGKTSANNRTNIAHAGVLATSVLYAGGQVKNGTKALEEKTKGDALLIETDRDSVVLDVVSSFDKIKYVNASKALVDESEMRLAKEEERVERAIANGLAVPFDRDKIKLARLELESRKTELEESENLLFEKLKYLTGMNHKELQDVVYELDPISLPDNLSADNKQELQALDSYKKASEWVLEKEKGSFLPQVLGFASLSYTGLFGGQTSFHLPNLPAQIPQPKINVNQFSVAPQFLVGVAFRWELFGGNERKNKVSQAQMNIQQLDNKLNDSKEKLNLLLLQKTASYKTIQKQIALAAQKEKVAGNNQVLATKQYAQGLISVTQRLEAETDYVKAGQEKVATLVHQRQVALEAMAVTGELSKKIIYQ